MVQTDWLNLPNRVTLARLFIAIALFVMLSWELHLPTDAGGRSLILNIATVIFVVCVATDWLDGYLARRLNLITAFGRLADPFVDKVVVLGSVIYLVVLAPEVIRPWFAVTLLAREFLVTGLRSFIESQGTPFGARLGGKLKMILQSITIPVVMCYQANLAELGDGAVWKTVGYWTCWGMVILTLIATLLSAWDYISVALASFRGSPPRNSS